MSFPGRVAVMFATAIFALLLMRTAAARPCRHVAQNEAVGARPADPRRAGLRISGVDWYGLVAPQRARRESWQISADAARRCNDRDSSSS